MKEHASDKNRQIPLTTTSNKSKYYLISLSIGIIVIISSSLLYFSQITADHTIPSIPSPLLISPQSSLLTTICNDEEWCSIQIPKKSLFGFDPPIDINKWRESQILAASGEQVLLKHIQNVINHPLDFLDGDVSFRSYHRIVDIFIDNQQRKSELLRLTSIQPTDTTKITVPIKQDTTTHNRHLQAVKTSSSTKPKLNPSEFLPPLYNFKTANRAPVIQLGYGLFKRR